MTRHERRRYIRNTAILLFIAALVASDAFAQKYTGSPVTKVRLIRAIKSKQFAVPTLVKQITISGVDFKVTPAVEGEFEAVNTNAAIVTAVRNNYRYEAEPPATTRGKTPARPVDKTDEQYETVYYQALDALNQMRASTTPAQAIAMARQVVDSGNRAIQLKPDRPEAYTLVGSAYLLTRNFAEAKRYGQNAIDRGGSLAFPVYHLYGQPHLEFIHIGHGFMTIESDSEFYQFGAAEVSSPRNENDYYTGNIRVATFSVTTRKNGRTDKWLFSPGNTGTTDEANLLIEMIKTNSIGR